MKKTIILFIVELVFNCLIIYFIPNNKYYKADYFMSISDNISSNNHTNLTHTIDMIEEKLQNSAGMNQIIFYFSIIVLVISLISLYILFSMLLFPSDYGHINGKNFTYYMVVLFIKFAFVITNISLSTSIMLKIKDIGKNIDEFGLTKEVRKKVLIIFILSGLCFFYYFFELSYNYIRKSTIIGFSIKEYNLENNRDEINSLNKKITEKEDQINLIKERIKSKDNEIDDQKKEVDRLNEELNKLTDENNTLKEKIEGLEQEKQQKDEDMKLKLKENNDKNDNKIREIENQKNLEIINLKKQYNLKENEKIITVIFQCVGQNILYSMICKNTDKFALIEQELYDIFPECKEKEYFFLFKGSKINRNKTLEEIGIKFSDVITFNEIVDFD